MSYHYYLSEEDANGTTERIYNKIMKPTKMNARILDVSFASFANTKFHCKYEFAMLWKRIGNRAPASLACNLVECMMHDSLTISLK